MRNFLFNTGSRICYGPDKPSTSGGWSPLTPGGTVNGSSSVVNDDGGGEPEPELPTEEELAEDPTLATDTENFFDAVSEVWDDPAPDGNAPKPPTQEEIEASKTAAATRLDNYVKGLDLGVTIDPAKFKEAAEAGDPAILATAMLEAQQKTYKQLLRDVTNMVGDVRKEMRNEMDTAAQRRLQVSASEQSLIQTLPFIEKNAALKPIAVAIKARFLKRGFSEDKANALTKRFFLETKQLTASALDDSTNITDPPGTRTGDRTYNQAPPRRGRQQNDQINWAELLTGRPASR